MLVRILIILVLIVPMFAAPPNVEAQSGNGTLAYAGHTRTYYHHVPSGYSEETPVSLIIALHPFASSGRAMATLTGLDATADSAGFIIAYPDSLDMTWNTGRAESAYPTGLQTTDDTGYILALIEAMSTEYAVNPEQVHLVGFGHGGAMAYRLACEIPDEFASVAVFGATLWNFQPGQCDPPTGTTSLFIALGDQDASSPPEGRILADASDTDPGLAMLSLAETRDFWLTRHNCPAIPTNTDAAETLQVYEDCTDGTTLTMWQIPHTGHMWPRSGPYNLNPTPIDFSAVMASYWQDATDWEAITLPDADADAPLRNYTYYLPPTYDPAEPLPVVIALHGRPDNGSSFAYRFDMNRFAASEGFAAVYPDGLENEWNYVRGFRGFPNTGVDDVVFLNALVEDLARNFSIDPRRVYLAGFSNGGFMAQRVACEAPEKYAGFAIFGAALFPGFPDLCEDPTPRPMLFVHGTRDVSIPWEGVRQGDLLLAYPVLDTVTFWLEHNDCAPELTRELIPPTSPAPTTFVRHYTFETCESGQPIEFYTIEGGGHNLPGIPDRISPEIAGAVNMDIHAAEITWAFFSQHALPAE